MAKKIVFMGTPMFAVPILKSLYQNGYPISDIYTQPPQKSQRGQKINKSPIQGIAETLNLNFRIPKNLKDNNEEYEYFKSIDADLAIVVRIEVASESIWSFGAILPVRVWELGTLDSCGPSYMYCSPLLLVGFGVCRWRGSCP